MPFTPPADPWMTWPEAIERVRAAAPDVDATEALYALLQAGEVTARWEVSHNGGMLLKPAQPDTWRKRLDKPQPTPLPGMGRPWFDHSTGEGEYGAQARIMLYRADLEAAIKARCGGGKARTGATVARAEHEARMFLEGAYSAPREDWPATKREAYEITRQHVEAQGYELSDKQFERAWKDTAPESARRPGRRSKSNPPR